MVNNKIVRFVLSLGWGSWILSKKHQIVEIIYTWLWKLGVTATKHLHILFLNPIEGDGN